MQYTKTNPEPVSERTPVFRNIHFSNITAEARQAGFLNGLSEMPIYNTIFNNLNIRCEKGFIIKEAQNIEFHNVQVSAAAGPSIVAENVESIELNGVKSLSPAPATSLIELINVKDAFLRDSNPKPGTDIFLKLRGENTKNIILQGNNLKNVKTEVVQDETVPGNVLSKNSKGN
jgi:hypothetical protein